MIITFRPDIGVGACVTVTSTGLPVALLAVTRIVAVRLVVEVLAVKLHVMVPELLPLAPDVIESQLPPDVTAAVQGMVPAPVLDTLKLVEPVSLDTFWLDGLTERAGLPACATVTSTGLPVAPLAVTRMVAVRDVDDVFAVKLHVMVPELLPLTPDVIESQLPPDVTAADHGMVPVPVLETLNVIVPESLDTLWLEGLTESAGLPACVTVTSTGLPDAPLAVTRMVAVRDVDDVFAVKLHMMVPELLPLTPDVIESQLPPAVTAAVQGMVSAPVLDTLKLVEPVSLDTFWLDGLTESVGVGFVCVVITNCGILD